MDECISGLVSETDGNEVRTLDQIPYYPASLQSDQGVLTTMPEWTRSAVGWILACVVDAARAIQPDASDLRCG
ncbi:MAG: hypothetical protein F4Y49_07500 [Dehalococcoidia bacterium]|nr:hypothetical protein [Dehalococcoidia bacterium]